MSNSRHTIRLATRGSALALWQANRTGELIRLHYPDLMVENVIISTVPDRVQDKPLHELGGDKGLFVKEVEQALLDGRADAAVHSLKDVPIEDLAPGTTLVAFPERADFHDVLVTRDGRGLASLPHGATVATGAPRRQAQVQALRPDLQVCGVRGNVETRLRKLMEHQFDAIVMAAAGLKRLSLHHHIAERFPVSRFVPAPGQGIVTVQAPDDSPWLSVLSSIDRSEVRLQAETERQFSRLLGADCHTAAGCILRLRGDFALLRATHLPEPGKHLTFKGTGSRADAMQLARDAASYFLNA